MEGWGLGVEVGDGVVVEGGGWGEEALEGGEVGGARAAEAGMLRRRRCRSVRFLYAGIHYERLCSSYGKPDSYT